MTFEFKGKTDARGAVFGINMGGSVPLGLDDVSAPVLPDEEHKPYGGDAFWLRPEPGVVGFVDRPELSRLRDWCTGEPRPSLMLMTGAGGVGKTRLARQLAKELVKPEWLCRQVSPGREAAGVVATVRKSHRGDVLLIVDYAENRPGLATLLQEITEADGDGRLRVLLIARGQGEWWQSLEASHADKVRALVDEAEIVPVGALKGAGLDRAELVRTAIPAFARALGVADPPDVPSVSIPAGEIPFLVLHATALLIVLDARDRPGASPTHVVADEKVLKRLLSREAWFWKGSAERAGAGVSEVAPAMLRQAVAVTCLFTAADEDEAVRLLGRVPGLDNGSVFSIARWLRQLYPVGQSPQSAQSTQWWGSLQPDLLAEYHAVAELGDSQAFARRCLHDLEDLQATEALTVLARAYAHRPQEARALISAAMRDDLPGLAIPAVKVAVRTPGPVGEIIADVVSDCDLPLTTLIQIEDAIPFPTVTLARADLVLTSRIYDMLPADSDDIAAWKGDLGAKYAQLGRMADALPYAKEATAILRDLAAAHDEFCPVLATSLKNLSVMLSDLGQYADALTHAQEAVTLYRDFAVTRPFRRWHSEIAMALDNLGARYWAAGQRADTLRLSQEAVTILRDLAATDPDPDSDRPDLAHLLNNLSVWYRELGQYADALPHAQEAVAIYRDLAATDPDRYGPSLAGSLSLLCTLLAASGQTADALPFAKEAVASFRDLAATDPDNYRPSLADALEKLSIWHRDLGRYADARKHAQEAVAIYRGLAATDPDPDRYRFGLARSLSALGSALYGAANTSDALPHTQEAVAIVRNLVATDHGRYRPLIAAWLNFLGIMFWELDHPADARAHAREAVTIYRDLAATDPDRYRPSLADALEKLSTWHQGRAAVDALPYAREAVTIYRDLAVTDPDNYRASLADALEKLSTWHRRLHQYAEALPQAREAVTIYRDLAATDPDNYRPSLADALEKLGAMSVMSSLESGRTIDGLSLCHEAVAIVRDLAATDPDPDRYRPRLANSLALLGTVCEASGRKTEAKAAQKEARAIRRKRSLSRTYGSFLVSICGLTCGYMQDSGFWFWLREPARDG